jgi:hypothetical protein
MVVTDSLVSDVTDSLSDVDGQLVDCSRMYQYISVVLLSWDSKLSLLSSTYTTNPSCSSTPQSQQATDKEPGSTRHV